MAFFTDLTRKIGVFGCKFYSHKNCVSVKKMTIIRYAQLYNCNCPKIWYHENWNNHVPAISQLCPYHKSQLVRLCSQSASLPVCLCKASELNLRIIKDQEYSRRRQQQDRVQSRGSRSLPQVVGWKRGGSKTKSFNFKNIESQKGRQNIPYLLFSWRRSGGSWSHTK